MLPGSGMCSHRLHTPHFCPAVSLVSQAGGKTDHRNSTKDEVTAKHSVSFANHHTVSATDRSTTASSLQMSKPESKPCLTGC